MSNTNSAQNLILLCTCPDDKVAAQLARQLIEQRLAACVNRFGGLTSTYMWDGELKEGTEVQLVIKTSVAAAERLIDTLQQAHPYELPEIIAVPITAGHAPYLQWIQDQTR